MSLAPSQKGDYCIVGTLGVGTFAKVKLAQHVCTKKKVALKILKKTNLSNKPEFLAKLQREISLMSLFDHPHILKLFEVFENNKNLFLAIEYAENGDLFELLIQGHSLSDEETMHYFRQMIYALEYMHLHEICHRDLKPENLLLDSNNNLKIADFGFAQWMKSKKSSKSCGSPHYAAPEIIQGRPYCGKKADVWSAGVVLYSMITGSLPFDDEQLPNLLKKIEHGEYDPPSTHPEIRDLISRMIVVDPDQRCTVGDVRCHPAFSMFMPDYYTVPVPLPLPQCNLPIDVSSIQPKIMKVLELIGFKSEDALIQNLLSDDSQNIAKVFYFMLIRQIDYEALPWGIANSLFVAKEFANNDPFVFIEDPNNNKQNISSIKEIKDLNNNYVFTADSRKYSLADKEDWVVGDSLNRVFEKEIVFDNIQYSLSDLFYEFQELLCENELCWFHPDDVTLLAKSKKGAIFVIVAEFSEHNTLSINLKMHKGTEQDFCFISNEMDKIVKSKT